MVVNIKDKNNSKQLRDLNCGDFFLFDENMLCLYVTDLCGNDIRVYSFNDESFVTYPDRLSVVPVSRSDIQIIVKVQ